MLTNGIEHFWGRRVTDGLKPSKIDRALICQECNKGGILDGRYLIQVKNSAMIRQGGCDLSVNRS